MQILITHGSLARSRVIHLQRWQVVLALFALISVLTLLSGTVYHFIFLKAAREGWPVVSQIVRLVVRDEFAQRDRFMRENLDAIARKVGEVQAKLVKLELMGERVSGLVGVKPDEVPAPLLAPAARAASAPGQGGPFVPAAAASVEQLVSIVDTLDLAAEQRTDLFVLVEARLLEARLRSMMVPNTKPVDGPVGSGYGFRADPFTGHAALHTGLDFPAEVGTPIVAAAAGVVTSVEQHPQYGQLLEVDHGRGLVTRYAHTARILVKLGDVIKRGQPIATVGTSGRSTGPHLHFEVVLDGVPQNPANFLRTAPSALAAR